MRFSLILCTINRVSEVERFLFYLNKQVYRDFELIIVDQNVDDRLHGLVNKYKKEYSIKYNQVNFKGLSRARNFGLHYVTGDIVTFPDDDCWYNNHNLFADLIRFFSGKDKLDGISLIVKDDYGNNVVLPWLAESVFISKQKVFFSATSTSFFLRKSIVDSVGLFDEMLGVGASTIYGSGEDVDYILRVILKNYKIYYLANLCVNHPAIIREYNNQTIKRGYFYSIALGYLLRKYKFPLYFKSRLLIRPLCGMFLFLHNFNRARYYFAVFRGRLRGLLCQK